MNLLSRSTVQFYFTMIKQLSYGKSSHVIYINLTIMDYVKPEVTGFFYRITCVHRLMYDRQVKRFAKAVLTVSQSH
ncbi:hypothetical protein EWB00_001148 [Schistosoma japonicum]|uniref:Uncharacterized protein n=1 Tax=Schistosoma japonicum TaxID=6182 RepID=A0A4Z2DH09_SCHJA|nr:hypothetical protein EWB00_001148 [Schistosoma japonicum]